MKKIKSHVFKQVSKQRTSLKGGQGMKALGAHLYTNFPSVPPPPHPSDIMSYLLRSLQQTN